MGRLMHPPTSSRSGDCVRMTGVSRGTTPDLDASKAAVRASTALARACRTERVERPVLAVGSRAAVCHPMSAAARSREPECTKYAVLHASSPGTDLRRDTCPVLRRTGRRCGRRTLVGRLWKCARRTCADVGRSPAVESCCAEKYCAGSCKAIGCVCFEGFSSTTCEPTAYCCPHLGCTSLETCTKYLATRDASVE